MTDLLSIASILTYFVENRAYSLASHRPKKRLTTEFSEDAEERRNRYMSRESVGGATPPTDSRELSSAFSVNSAVNVLLQELRFLQYSLSAWLVKHLYTIDPAMTIPSPRSYRSVNHNIPRHTPSPFGRTSQNQDPQRRAPRYTRPERSSRK
jgi:hypothetical protein